MRDELKNLFGEEIILEDGSHCFYTVEPYEMKNMLGAVVAVLDEYSFTKKGSSAKFKLYRTQDGNWYNKNDENNVVGGQFLQALKTAINNKEDSTTVLNK